ncbi:hypothetical protein AYO38_01715 [bacterium SCGC AG-212-C10]|nr:hypothetical protein AYO38_01715 [bacterium SCGC AG-212-C10]
MIASTRQDKARGERLDGMSVFRGAPFAAPPVSDLRFCAPQPASPWDGIREAVAFGNASPQPGLPAGVSAGGIALCAGMDEDCLYLNVWTPAVDEAKRPVMVWIHSGNFTMGAGSSATDDLATLVRRGDVVADSCNYRLGALGYLYADRVGRRERGWCAECAVEEPPADSERRLWDGIL